MINIEKKVFLNAAMAGLLASGAVILKSVLKDSVNINIDMNDMVAKASNGVLIYDESRIANLPE